MNVEALRFPQRSGQFPSEGESSEIQRKDDEPVVRGLRQVKRSRSPSPSILRLSCRRITTSSARRRNWRRLPLFVGATADRGPRYAVPAGLTGLDSQLQSEAGLVANRYRHHRRLAFPNIQHDVFIDRRRHSQGWTPGRANCHGKSVSALAPQFGGISAAASALGFSGVAALQDGLRAFCGK